MGSQVEATVKALVEFEAELDRLKAEALEAKARMVKDAQSLSEAAKSGAVARAQRMTTETLAKAKARAEVEASEIRRKGEAELAAFEASISKRKASATALVVSRLLGEST